jgi:mono/diheme cytochrome c family protein
LLAILYLTIACADGPTSAVGDSGNGGLAAERISWSAQQTTPSPPVTAALIAQGEQVYSDNCAACHGSAGAADGVCAAFLAPQPRDFTSGIFRFKSTPGGHKPTDRDLFKTVSAGLHGTGMPPWRFLLTDQERWAVVHFLKTFSQGFEEPSGVASIELAAPPKITPTRLDNGKRLFLEAECNACHGVRGYGDGPSAPTLVDDFGRPIAPRNFHKIPQFKRGFTLADIALTIHTGNNGTPMPSFGESYSADQIWDLAAYVHSLGARQLSGGGAPAADSYGAELGKPDVVIELIERSWRYVPETIRVKQGQVVRIEFQPTDNGLGAGHGFAIDGYDRVAFINGAMVQRPKSVTFRADRAGTFTFYCSSQCSTGPLHPNMKGTLVVEPAA